MSKILEGLVKNAEASIEALSDYMKEKGKSSGHYAKKLKSLNNKFNSMVLENDLMNAAGDIVDDYEPVREEDLIVIAEALKFRNKFIKSQHYNYHNAIQLIAYMAMELGWDVSFNDEGEKKYLYLLLPTGQITFGFFKKTTEFLCDAVPKDVIEYDGHTSEEKQERITRLLAISSIVKQSNKVDQ